MQTYIWTSSVWDYERLTTLYKSVSGSQCPTDWQRVSLKGWKNWDYRHSSGRSWILPLQESRLVELQSDPAHPIQGDELPGTQLYLLLQLHLVFIFLLCLSLSSSVQPVSNFSLFSNKTLIANYFIVYIRRYWVLQEVNVMIIVCMCACLKMNVQLIFHWHLCTCCQSSEEHFAICTHTAPHLFTSIRYKSAVTVITY